MYKTLDRNKQFMGQDVPDWATAAAYTGGYWYFEESLEQEVGQRFQRIRGFDQGLGATVTYSDVSQRGYIKAVKFSEQAQQDDPLPPAPESVRYYSNTPVNVNYLEIQIGPRSEEVCITSTCGLNTFCNYLEPDAVLQLAHDLNRMANEIKRKEKQRG